jgi:hypothetical protein
MDAYSFLGGMDAPVRDYADFRSELIFVLIFILFSKNNFRSLFSLTTANHYRSYSSSRSRNINAFVSH